jgi:Rrf2 family protein
MKFSKKSRYGLRALIDLSVNSKTDHVALSSIAERNGISLQYLEQVFASLRRAEIVKSIKGPQGGYLLNDSAENITVASILEALDAIRLKRRQVPRITASRKLYRQFRQ